MTLLSLDKVSKSFGGVAAVRSVSLKVEAGEILGVMGPNGSGKTTLFNLISGALVPDSGEIQFLGGRTNGLPPHRICRRGLARTFQLVRPFLGLTVLENVLVGLGYGCQRLTGSAARDRARLPRGTFRRGTRRVGGVEARDALIDTQGSETCAAGQLGPQGKRCRVERWQPLTGRNSKPQEAAR